MQGPGATQAVVEVIAGMHLYLLDEHGNHAVLSADAVPMPLVLRTDATNGVNIGAVTTVEGCFCSFPFQYGYGSSAVIHDACVDGGRSYKWCGTRDMCGTTGSSAASMSTNAFDYCAPEDQTAVVWQQAASRFDLLYMPIGNGTLALQASVDGMDCDTATVDVRHGGRLLITEVHYNPPDIPINNVDTNNHSEYVWQIDGCVESGSISRACHRTLRSVCVLR